MNAQYSFDFFAFYDGCADAILGAPWYAPIHIAAYNYAAQSNWL